MNRFFSAFTVSIVGLMIVSCSGETVDYSEPQVTPPGVTELPDVTPPNTPSAPLKSIAPETVADFNEFALNFYLANSVGSHRSLCVSPFSVGAVLGMIANGDDGDSRNSILKMLGFEESDSGLEALNTYYQTMLSNLPNIEEGIACNVTNTLWYDPSRYLMRKTFINVMTDYYYAYEIGINPGGEVGKTAINEFVDKNTNGLIKNFLKTPLQIDLAFLSTLYFKAGWNSAFYELEKEEGRFLDIDGKVQETDFMWRTDYTEYGIADDGTEAIRLNYGEKKQFSMTCILPSSLINHIALDEVLSVENLNALKKSMRKEYMRVKLPKFEIETNNDNTIGVLKSLGLNCGPFSLIADSSDFFLDTFIHATKINVDENGTEGAAASLGGWLGLGGSEENSVIPEIVFDRPFIFYIQENTTGAILFIGAVKTFS